MDDDGDDKSDTKRRTRNLSEKKRRDQFNMLIHELSTMLTTNGRKMDKSTVLKSTISFLKNHNEITLKSRAHDVQEEWKPSFLSNEEFTYLILEALEGFVMVFSSTGRICYASESITSILGHHSTQVVNQSIFDLTCEEDRPILYNLLQRNVAATEQIQSVSQDNEMVTFELHLKRGASNNDETTYELIMFNGHFRSNFEDLEDDRDGYQQDMESRVLFVGTGRLYTPQLIRDVSLVDPNRSEFTSRHSLEWKFLFLDHRAPPIIGYLPFEVLGTSGYDYYHFDDLEKVVSCHEELKQKGELTSCYYRFLTKGQQWIWLQTRFYITYHQWHSKPEFVVCTHRVISYMDITKTTKEEAPDTDNMSEAESCGMKHPPSEEAALSNMSPSYMSETSDAFCSSYRTQSPVESTSSRLVATLAPSEDTAMAPLSPSYMSEASEPYGSSYQSHSQSTKRQRMNDGGHSDDTGMAPLSPSYMSEASETYNTYRTRSQPASVKSVSEVSWRRVRRYAPGSDTASVSGESHCSARHSSVAEPTHKGGELALTPQHGIGAQYLEPVPYVSVPAVLPMALPLRPVPVIVTQDQAQIQEQLQRKHEELQQMIVRQQEELQQVKEQLLLARLGILQPVINVPYGNPEQLQQQQINQQLPQITYESSGAPPTVYTTHPPLPSIPSHPSLPSHPSHPPQQLHSLHAMHPMHPEHSTHSPHPSHPSHPPHTTGPHQHMPQ